MRLVGVDAIREHRDRIPGRADDEDGNSGSFVACERVRLRCMRYDDLDGETSGAGEREIAHDARHHRRLRHAPVAQANDVRDPDGRAHGAAPEELVRASRRLRDLEGIANRLLRSSVQGALVAAGSVDTYAVGKMPTDAPAASARVHLGGAAEAPHGGDAIVPVHMHEAAVSEARVREAEPVLPPRRRASRVV